MSSKRSKQRSAAPLAIPTPQPRGALQAQGPQWWWYALGLFLAFFTAFEIYGPAIRGPFLFDDRYLPFFAPGFADAPLKTWLVGVRPMLMLGYWVNFQFSKTDPYSYHLVNVLFHLANAVMVWLAAARLMEWAGVTKSRRILLSLFAGILFLVHPMQTESVTYVASRSETQSLFFFLGAFLLFLYRTQTAVSIPVALGVLGLSGAAFLSKEHTALLPVLLLLTDFFWNPGFSLEARTGPGQPSVVKETRDAAAAPSSVVRASSFEGIRKNWKLYAPVVLLGTGAAFLVVRVLTQGLSAGFGMKDLPWYAYFFSQCRAIWVYLRMLVLPYDLNADHDFAVSRSLLDHGAILGMAALIGVTVAAWIWRKKYPLAAYGWFAALILLAPTSSFIPIRDLLVDRRVYLPFLPLVLIACEALWRWKISDVALGAALAAILMVFGVLSFQRSEVWADPILLWKDTAAKSPDKQRPRFQLAFALYSEGRCAEAVQEYQRAAELSKPDYDLLVDWGIAADCAQQPALAVDRFQQAAGIDKTAHVYYLIGTVYGKRKQAPEALAALDQAQKIDPNYQLIYVARGNVLLLTSEFEKAAEQFKQALQLKPGDDAATKGLDMANRRFVPAVE